MLPYLHILIRVEEDEALHALAAFTSKEKQDQYQKDAGLSDAQIRHDFFNGPFDPEILVIYAGHRHWNMDRFQIAGYFKNEREAWTWVTQEGYVSVLQVDASYEAEKTLEKEALDCYSKRQKQWRLRSYQDLVADVGTDKARANVMLRFYEDGLESFKPNTKRDLRALYAFFVLILIFPIAVFFFLSSNSDYAENVPSVTWLPSYASNVSFYRSKQVQVYEFEISPENFSLWAKSKGMAVSELDSQKILSRYAAYIPTKAVYIDAPMPPLHSAEQFQTRQHAISVTTNSGLIAQAADNSIAVYLPEAQKAYFEHLSDF